MKTFQVIPNPVLHPFIDRFWGWKSTGDEIVRLPTVLPGTGAELYLHWGDPFRYVLNDGQRAKCAYGHLFCVRQKPIRLAPSPNISFIAVRFRAGMLHRFTPIPGRELLDRVLSVEEIWGSEGTALLGKLSYAKSSAERLLHIQSFLERQLKNRSLDVLVERAIPMIYKQCVSISVDGLAEKLHLGRRQLERRFMAFAGQSPGEVKCLSRFQHTVRKLVLDASADPTDIALANGYYDQAHFIHDFQRRASTTPGRYLEDARMKTHFYNTSRRADGTLRTPITHQEGVPYARAGCRTGSESRVLRRT